MPSSTAFSLPGTNSRHDQEESMLDGSDLEEFNQSYPIDTYSSRYYWLGKLVLFQLLGEAVFHDAAVLDTSDNLDVSHPQCAANQLTENLQGCSNEQNL